jgi:uncharacterized membrane protein
MITVLAAAHGKQTISTWLAARGSDIALVIHDLTIHVRPPAGPSLTFAVAVVLLIITLPRLAKLRSR